MSRLLASLSLVEPATAQAPETGLRQSLQLVDAPELWVAVLVIVPALALVCWLGYARESITPLRRLVLPTKRIVAIATQALVL